jgi:hypothetical protein
MKTIKTKSLFMDITDSNDDNDRYPYQSILNLYESNISTDVIASQLDISQIDVVNALENVNKDKQNNEKSIIDASYKPKNEMINSVSNVYGELFTIYTKKNMV